MLQVQSKYKQPLKYLTNFWRTLEKSKINCEINLILNWSPNCVISRDAGVTTFAITDTKLYLLVVTVQFKIIGSYSNNNNKGLNK